MNPSPRSNPLLTMTALALLALGACKPDKPDVLEARRAEAQERATNVQAAVAQSGSGAAVAAASAKLGADQAQLEVARVGDVVITLGDVATRIAGQPPHMQTRYAAAEPRRKLLEDMVHLEVLVLEAQKQGLTANPRVQFAWKEALARELLEAKTKASGTMHAIDEAAVAAHYQAHQPDFFRPERRRAALLLVGTKAKADALLTQMRQAIAEAPRRAPQIFGDFVAQHSLDQLTKLVKGDLGWFDVKGEPDDRRPKPPTAIIAPVFALAGVNAISDPFPVDQRWALVQLTNRREARRAPLDEVKLDIKNQLFRAQRTRAREAAIAELMKAATVTIDEAALAKLQVPKAAGDGAKPASKVRGTVGRIPLLRRAGAANARPAMLKAPVRVSPEARIKGEELLEKIQQGKERERKRGEATQSKQTEAGGER